VSSGDSDEGVTTSTDAVDGLFPRKARPRSSSSVAAAREQQAAVNSTFKTPEAKLMPR
jgi:hypothetical protein